ncbi:MAG: WYL domain-containing protein [Flavobacteriales bacterium]|jgi:predicted DNA-binding transcriptional regulator YafY|nr:WYL domain-containing protein [Flavobacteriales bacterium]
MAHQDKLKRYLLILERLPHRPSFADLAGHLEEHGLALSHRTLQRDIEEIRAQLGMRVVYDRPANTYALSEADSGSTGMLHLLERAQWLEVVRSAGGNAGLDAAMAFEGGGRAQGVLQAAPLLRAVRERREARVRYRTGHGATAKEARIMPHLLKEHHGRWYVLGRHAGNRAAVALPLDQVLHVHVLAKRGAKPTAAHAAQYAAAVGVDVAAGKPRRVVLRVEKPRAAQVIATPVHPSQQVVEQDRNGVTIALEVVPGPVLREQLLAWGADVRVLAPKALAREIRQAHKAAAARYKT